MIATFFDGWSDWWSTVTPEFAFLLALPFVIGALCFVAERLRAVRVRRPHSKPAQPHRRFPRRAARLHH